MKIAVGMAIRSRMEIGMQNETEIRMWMWMKMWMKIGKMIRMELRYGLILGLKWGLDRTRLD